MRPIALALAALGLLSACPGGQAALERAVREYDDELQRAYATADASRLPGVATRKEANRVLVLIDLKTASRVVLESKLEAFEVTRAQSSGDAGTVETRERWRYRDRKLKPGEQTGPDLVAAMAMRYDLVREDGRWKVAAVATLSNEYLEPPGMRPGRAPRQGQAHGAVPPAPVAAPGATAPGTGPRP